MTAVRSRVRVVAIGRQAKRHTGVLASGLRDDHHSPWRSAIACSRTPGRSTRRVKLERRFRCGAPGGRTLNQWVKSSPAQRSRRATCTNATVQWRLWPSLHWFRRYAVPRPVPRLLPRLPVDNHRALPRAAELGVLEPSCRVRSSRRMNLHASLTQGSRSWTPKVPRSAGVLVTLSPGSTASPALMTCRTFKRRTGRSRQACDLRR